MVHGPISPGALQNVHVLHVEVMLRIPTQNNLQSIHHPDNRDA